MNQFSVIDYLVFAVSLLICAGAGVYYLILEKRNKRRLKKHHHHHHNHENKQQGIQLSELPPNANNKTDAVDENEEAIRVTSAREYFLGGRHLLFWPSVFSLFASFWSAIGLLGHPAEIYSFGSVTLLSGLAYIPAAIIVVLFYIPIYYRNKFNSVFEYVEVRFESALLRKITAIGSACASIAYAAVCAYVPSVAFNLATGLPEWLIIVAAGLVTIFYTAVGGLKAVVLVDTIQAVIMFIGITICLILGAVKIGGIEYAWEFSTEMGRVYLTNWSTDPRITHSIWAVGIGGTFHWLAGIANNQATLQRACAMDTLAKAQWSLIVVSPLVILLMVIIWLTTLVAFAYYNGIVKCDPITSGIITNPNQIIPYFVQDVMYYPGFLGVFYSCLFSGSISSMSTAYNTVSSMLWEDWLRPILEPKLTKRQILITIKSLSGFVGILVGIIAILAKYVGGTAIKASVSFMGAFTGSVHAVYFCGAFLPFVTSHSLIVGICTSLPLTLAILIYQIIKKPYSHPMLPMVTSDCPSNLNSTVTALIGKLLFNGTVEEATTTTAAYYTDLYNNSSGIFDSSSTFFDNSSSTAPADLFLNLTTHKPSLMSVTTNDSPSHMFALSYTYFPLFSFVCCLVMAIVVSLINIALSKCFPKVAWLKPQPERVNSAYLAFHCIKVLGPRSDNDQEGSDDRTDSSSSRSSSSSSRSSSDGNIKKNKNKQAGVDDEDDVDDEAKQPLAADYDDDEAEEDDHVIAATTGKT